MAAILIGAALTAAASAHAAGAGTVTGPGQFAISPARRTVIARPPVTLAPTRVSNTTSTPIDVSVFPVLLHQQLSGAFIFSETPQDINAARLIVPVQPVSFTLNPGAARIVDLGWQLLPLKTRAAYIGVVFQGKPRTRAAQSLSVVDRLLSVNFLRLPGHFASGGTFTALRAQQFGPNDLRVLARVKNTGEVVEAPQDGRLKIVDETGRLVYRARWSGDVVLPRAQRDFTIPVAKALPAGVYTATATMRFGATQTAQISNDFVLTGPNQLPTPRIAVASLQGQGTIGGPAEISAQIRSVGNAPAGTTVRLALSATSAGVPIGNPIAQRSVSFARLAPGDTRDLDARLGSLKSGGYRVTATYEDTPGSTQTLVTDFVATPARAGSAGRFLRIHWVEILLAAAFIVIAFLGALMMRRQRHLQARLEALQAQAAASRDRNGRAELDREPAPEREVPRSGS